MAVCQPQDSQFGVRDGKKDNAVPVGKASDTMAELTAINARQASSREAFDLAIDIDKEAIGSLRVFLSDVGVVVKEVCSSSRRPDRLPVLNSASPYSGPQTFV
jgi:hypothetical protein